MTEPERAMLIRADDIEEIRALLEVIRGQNATALAETRLEREEYRERGAERDKRLDGHDLALAELRRDVRRLWAAVMLAAVLGFVGGWVWRGDGGVVVVGLP